ncbi:LysR family transcriptional regulator ArgP [Rathayibacter tanaceti]|uniref:ArgP/LysG family DNA-binding transcriptional regulator n=2 Tax=Rathayibacter tanaceti TaxID=1671680 RepID=A0A162FVN4_9MICO|nr:LysR family transcriptional regulator ArgP [Rathayibacter tanaceti]KZX20230.1 putative HTH-type transcriptional regulator/MT2039 [Rathayibacter tanaceti]QHC56540.1 ArgP/LysG family DNA-binding transcriptional regulator [Rathayibacter tanaceti]TCO36754.1 LysR family transcriptional regulator (chromosome initiation inhibitor) [Rathayibacter tanaceti]
MLTDDLDLSRLRALAASVRHGSFDAAARALHITPSALSQRIKALETAAGRVLLVRSRPVVATEAGAGLLRLARQIELLAEDAVRALGGEDAQGAGPVVLPLAVNADSLATWVLPALASVPDVVVELHREDQEHTAAFLRNGTVLAAVTGEAEAVLGCTVAPLGVMRYRAMAAPAFAERWFPSGDLSALGSAPLVVFDEKDRLQERFLRSAGVEGGPPQHRVPGSTDFAQAVRLGLGWGMLPELQAPVGSEGLVALGGAPVDVPLYWQQWALRTPALDAVAVAVASAARARLRRPLTGDADERR